MEYYLIIIKPDSQAIYAHDTQDSAMSAFHSEMAYAYNAKISTTCIITDTFGSQIKSERYEAINENTDSE